MRTSLWRILAVAGGIAFVAGVTPARAQLNTQHIKGTAGLKSGSQPPPHSYVILPLLFLYKTDTVKDAQGDPFGVSANLTSGAFAAGFVQVTTKKILGGFYSYQLLFPAWVNNRIQGTEIDSNPGAGLTDSAVTPINLGWHFKQADALFSYNIFVPTGSTGFPASCCAARTRSSRSAPKCRWPSHATASFTAS